MNWAHAAAQFDTHGLDACRPVQATHHPLNGATNWRYPAARMESWEQRGVDPGQIRAIRKSEDDRPPPCLHGPTSQFVPPSFGRNVSRSFPVVPR